MFQAAGAWFSFKGEEELEEKWTTFFPNVHSKYNHQTYTLLKPDNTRPTESEGSLMKLNLTMILGKKIF